MKRAAWCALFAVFGGLPPAVATAQVPTETSLVGSTSDFVSPGPVAIRGQVSIIMTAARLVAQDADGATDVYAISGADVALVSTGPADVHAETPAYARAVSDDGRRVVWATEARLTSEDTDIEGEDLYLRDLDLGTTRLLSAPEDPAQADVRVEMPSGGASADLLHVAMETQARLTGEDLDGNETDVYVRDVAAARTALASGGASPRGSLSVQALGMSADGVQLLMGTGLPLADGDTDGDRGDCYVWSREAGVRWVTPGAPSNREGSPTCHLPRDGARVIVKSDLPLLAGDSDGQDDLFAYDLRSGATSTLLESWPSAGGRDQLYLSAVSDDGQTVLVNTAEALTGDDRDAERFDAFAVRDGLATRLSRPAPEAPEPDDDVFGRFLSQDGSRAILLTPAPLAVADVNGLGDGYAVDTRTGTVQQITRAVGVDGPLNPGTVGISPDGRRIVFETRARLASTDRDGKIDVYEHVDGSVRMLSVPAPGVTDPQARDVLLALGGRSPYAQPTAVAADRTHMYTGERLAAADTDDSADVYLSSPSGMQRPTEEPVGPAVPLPERTTPPDPAPPPGPARADRVAPRISAMAIRGRTVTFRLNERARVVLRLEREAGGRRRAGRCTTRARRGPKCTIRRKVLTRALSVSAGVRRVTLPRLRRGTYRVTLVAVDAAGNRNSASRSLTRR